MKIIRLLTNAVIILSLFSCSTTKTDTPKISEPVDSNYSSQQFSELKEKHWKLIELNGKKISDMINSNHPPYFIMKTEQNIFEGKGTCNSFFGRYMFSSGNQITFSSIGSTEMACEDMEIERQFFRMFTLIDNYSIKNDSLVFNNSKKVPLAKFLAVNE